MPGETSVAARMSDASSQSSANHNRTSSMVGTDVPPTTADASTFLGDTLTAGDFGPNATLAVLNSTQRPSMRAKKIGHRRVDESGQVFYKRTPTQELMETIQLGIYTSLAFAEKMGQHDLLYRDFKRIEILDFPSDTMQRQRILLETRKARESALPDAFGRLRHTKERSYVDIPRNNYHEGGGEPPTPAHRFADFKFRSYAPTAFRHFRRAFQIEPTDFMRSLCDDSLRELSNPGASGSVFYLTADDNFIIKTVQHNEADFLLKLLPGYYMNLTQNPRTLLPKFYGLFTYQSRGKNIRFIIMNNLLPSNVTFHEKYDLKGSTFKRRASQKEREKKIPTLKDLDFMEEHPEGIILDAEKFEALRMTIERDCRVLESFKIMDYSLLLGIHNHTAACQAGAATAAPPTTAPPTVATPHTALGPENMQGAAGAAGLTVAALVGGVTGMSARLQPAFHTAMEAIQGAGRPSGGDQASMVNADSEIFSENPLPRDADHHRHHQTPGQPLTPTTSCPQMQCDHRGGIPAHNAKGDQLYLYVGVIDILQDYRLKKKLEHAFKAVVYDGDTVSVCRPSFYSNRFQQFMINKVFRRGPSARQRFRSIVHLAIKVHSKDSVKRKVGVSAKRQGGVLTNRPDLLPPNADVFVRELSPPAIPAAYVTGGTVLADESAAGNAASALGVTFSDDTVNNTYEQSQVSYSGAGPASAASSFATATSTTPTSFRNKTRVTSSDHSSSISEALSATQQPSIAILPASPSPPQEQTTTPVSDESVPPSISDNNIIHAKTQQHQNSDAAPIASPESISIDFMKPVVVSSSSSSFSAVSTATLTRADQHEPSSSEEESNSSEES